jgi:hypothetical protein
VLSGDRPVQDRAAWKAIEQHHAEIGPRHLRVLFAEDPGRGERLSAQAVLYFPQVPLQPTRWPTDLTSLHVAAGLVALVCRSDSESTEIYVGPTIRMDATDPRTQLHIGKPQAMKVAARPAEL